MNTFKAAKWIAIDIETRNLTPEQIDFEGLFVKAHPNTKDPEKIAAQMERKKADIANKGGLTNSAEIGCVGIWTDKLPEPAVFHTFRDCPEHYQYGNETDMLTDLKSTLDSLCDPDTVIVVANATFDLPKLRYAMSFRCKIGLPEILKPGCQNKVFDVLYIASKYFLLGTEFVSLDNLALHAGIEGGGKQISGKEIPDLIDQGQGAIVAAYNAIDVLMTAKIYQLMQA